MEVNHAGRGAVPQQRMSVAPGSRAVTVSYLLPAGGAGRPRLYKPIGVEINRREQGYLGGSPGASLTRGRIAAGEDQRDRHKRKHQGHTDPAPGGPPTYTNPH